MGLLYDKVITQERFLLEVGKLGCA